jgi:hypothetical protein
MDEARVMIDLKEGIIELQGPLDFVRHYLDMYQPAVKRMNRATGPAQPRRRAAGKRDRSIPCTRAILNELEAGFFDQPRSTSDIKQQLGEAGFSFTDNNVRNSLKRMTASGALGSSGKSATLRYHRPA